MIVPDTGYQQKEIILDSLSSLMDIFIFLKVGNHFGKLELSGTGNHSTLGFDKTRAFLKFELDINKKEGDRILRRALEDDYIPRYYY
jgi:hypothetical protein